jgi:hypothetical protein
MALILALAATAGTADTPSQSRVEFGKGNDKAAINGTITGDEYIDYLLGAKAGQTMAGSLIPGESNGIANLDFNTLPPGSSDKAIDDGSIDGLDATGISLPKCGDCTIRVHQLGDHADTGKTAAFAVSIGINWTRPSAALPIC